MSAHQKQSRPTACGRTVGDRVLHLQVVPMRCALVTHHDVLAVGQWWLCQYVAHSQAPPEAPNTHSVRAGALQCAPLTGWSSFPPRSAAAGGPPCRGRRPSGSCRPQSRTSQSRCRCHTPPSAPGSPWQAAAAGHATRGGHATAVEGTDSRSQSKPSPGLGVTQTYPGRRWTARWVPGHAQMSRREVQQRARGASCSRAAAATSETTLVVAAVC